VVLEKVLLLTATRLEWTPPAISASVQTAYTPPNPKVRDNKVNLKGEAESWPEAVSQDSLWETHRPWHQCPWQGRTFILLSWLQKKHCRGLRSDQLFPKHT
jgi:hypothetical protein